jgi:hypothetical protein
VLSGGGGVITLFHGGKRVAHRLLFIRSTRSVPSGGEERIGLMDSIHQSMAAIERTACLVAGLAVFGVFITVLVF